MIYDCLFTVKAGLCVHVKAHIVAVSVSTEGASKMFTGTFTLWLCDTEMLLQTSNVPP